MPSPKTTKRYKLLCILCLRRNTVYTQNDTTSPARIDHMLSVRGKPSQHIENKSVDLASTIYKRAEEIPCTKQKRSDHSTYLEAQAISVIKEFPGFKKFMQQNTMLLRALGTCQMQVPDQAMHGVSIDR